MTTKMKLFWVYTPCHEEDWFIIAHDRKTARKYHEEYEGFDYGYAMASLIGSVEKKYERRAVYHAQLPMLEDMGFTVLSDGPYRVVIKEGRVYQEGSVIKFSLLNGSDGKEGLYIVHAVGSDLYKIGITKHLRARLRNMQTGSPLVIELYNFWKTNHSKVIERMLHRRYKARSVGKEWFLFSRADLEMIHNDVCFLKELDIDSLISVEARNSN